MGSETILILTKVRVALATLLCLFLLAATSLLFAAEPAIPQDSGKPGLEQMLRKLRTTARLLHTAAHPDDEDGGMLTLEARGHGVTAMQLTLNRGEGGQNATGNILGDELGILRTLELLEADRYYGVEQRFTRVADFGFSKTAEETFEKWHGHDVALADMVRVIRTFRPDVIISRFAGNSGDGHGNHQASGILTREAFRAAADPNRFPEQIKEGLQPWQAKKLYIRGRADDYTVQLNTDEQDPLLGMSYIQWGWQGLKHQLSQGAAFWNLNNVQASGRFRTYYKLVDTTIPNYKPEHEKDFFDGIDTSLMALAAQLGSEVNAIPGLRKSLESLAKHVDEAEQASKGERLDDAAKPLLAGLNETEKLIAQLGKAKLSPQVKDDLLTELETKREQFAKAANIALRLTLTAKAQLSVMQQVSEPKAQYEVVATPGEQIDITAALETDKQSTRLENVRVQPEGEIVSKQEASASSKNWLFPFPAYPVTVTIAANAPYTRQYFYRKNPETDAIYTIRDERYATLPLTPPPLHVRATYQYGGYTGEIETTVDVALPTLHPLIIGPEVAVAVTPPTAVVRAGGERPTEITADLRSNSATPISPTFVLRTADNSHPVPFKQQKVELSAPAKPEAVESSVDAQYLKTGDHHLEADAQLDGKTYNEGYRVVTREDLGSAYFFSPATQRVSVVEVKLPAGLKVGYVMGAGDDIPTVLKEIGIDVTVISPQELASGDLGKYDTIVLGIRAYDTQKDVRDNNNRLLDYVSNGGTLIVQYNQQYQQFNEGKFTPYPATESRDRVAVEEVPVDMLVPTDSIFHVPNEIGTRDFSDWVQERGLYFMSDWDPHYEPLLSSHDPGEQPLKGGLLRTKYGKGTYIYSAYAFFRQLPAGVPGAIRLFVNLLDAGHEQASSAVARQ